MYRDYIYRDFEKENICLREHAWDYLLCDIIGKI